MSVEIVMECSALHLKEAKQRDKLRHVLASVLPYNDTAVIRVPFGFLRPDKKRLE